MGWIVRVREKLGIEQGSQLVLELREDQITLSKVGSQQMNKSTKGELKEFLGNIPKTTNV